MLRWTLRTCPCSKGLSTCEQLSGSCLASGVSHMTIRHMTIPVSAVSAILKQTSSSVENHIVIRSIIPFAFESRHFDSDELTLSIAASHRHKPGTRQTTADDKSRLPAGRLGMWTDLCATFTCNRNAREPLPAQSHPVDHWWTLSDTCESWVHPKLAGEECSTSLP